MSRTVANLRHPTSNNISLLPYPHPVIPHLKVNVICVSPHIQLLKSKGKYKKSSSYSFRDLDEM